MELHEGRAHAFVDDLDAPVLDPDDAHHLGRVLRVRPGDTITVSDGAGGWRACRFGEPLEVVGEPVGPRPRARSIGVAIALVKGDRPEWAVQKLTELGVDLIVPFHAARSVVRWEGDRAVRGVARLRRIAREAAMQSRQTHLPVVEDVAGFGDLAVRPGAALASLGGDPPQLERSFVLVGPEGGWAPEERDAGLPTLGLGPSVLRTETAAVTAGALLAALRAGILSTA